MMYDRKIKYLDYYEGGERVRGVGFAKLEVREDKLRLELTVRGLHPTDSFVRDVVLCSEDSEGALGQIHIRDGSGMFRYEGSLSDGVGSTGILYEALTELHIPIGGTRAILCSIGNPAVRSAAGRERSEKAVQDALWQEREDEIQEDRGESMEETREEGMEENMEITREEGTEETREEIREQSIERVQSAIEKETRAEISEDSTAEKQQETSGNEAAVDPEERKEMQAMSGEQKLIHILEEELEKVRKPSEEPSSEPQKAKLDLSLAPGNGSVNRQEKPEEPKSLQDQLREKRSVRLQEDKWKQLTQIYPHIQPFQDDRDYLSLTPADFVLFPAKYYKLVNNSFLLHGYYNYNHLILARVKQRGETRYYLGVPGNYFDREKQVAVMFGFESFECANEPAKTGDFGYYMMRTEL